MTGTEQKASKRTDQQRKALEVYCRLLAEELNFAGLDMQIVLMGGEKAIQKAISKALTPELLLDPGSYMHIIEAIAQNILHIREVPLNWTQNSVKERIWKPILKAKEDKESTTEMTTVDPTEIKREIDRYLGQTFGFIGPSWPSLR